jgi:hypothetical protein
MKGARPLQPTSAAEPAFDDAVGRERFGPDEFEVRLERVGEEGVPVGDDVQDPRDQELVDPVPEGGVDLRPADHEGRPPRLRQRGVEAFDGRRPGAVGGEGLGPAGDDEVVAARQRPARQSVPGHPAHHHRPAEGRPLEEREVLRVVPGQPPGAADAAGPVHRDDADHQTATVPLSFGCGS